MVNCRFAGNHLSTTCSLWRWRHNPTDNDSADNDPTDNDSADNDSADNDSPDNDSADNNPTDNNPTDNNGYCSISTTSGYRRAGRLFDVP